MRWFAEERRIVREVYRDYHRFFWLPAHYAIPCSLGFFALALGLQVVTGLGV